MPAPLAIVVVVLTVVVSLIRPILEVNVSPHLDYWNFYSVAERLPVLIGTVFILLIVYVNLFALGLFSILVPGFLIVVGYLISANSILSTKAVAKYSLIAACLSLLDSSRKSRILPVRNRDWMFIGISALSRFLEQTRGFGFNSRQVMFGMLASEMTETDIVKPLSTIVNWIDNEEDENKTQRVLRLIKKYRKAALKREEEGFSIRFSRILFLDRVTYPSLEGIIASVIRHAAILGVLLYATFELLTNLQLI